MFKLRFSKNKKASLSNDLSDTNEIKDWLRDNYILAPNNTTVKDLKKFQRLIVLRTPWGEKRCIVDTSLRHHDSKHLHKKSLKTNVEIDNEKVLRIIDETLNFGKHQKIVEPEIESETMINQIDGFLSAIDKEFQNLKSDEYDEENLPILTIRDHKTDAYFDNVKKSSLPKSQLAIDSKNAIAMIDNVVIKTDADSAIREGWKTIDLDMTKQKDNFNRIHDYLGYSKADENEYVIKIQPLFRNFIDVDLYDYNQYLKFKNIAKENKLNADQKNPFNQRIFQNEFDLDLVSKKYVNIDKQLWLDDINTIKKEIKEQKLFFKSAAEIAKMNELKPLNSTKIEGKKHRFYQSVSNYDYNKIIKKKKKISFKR